MTFISTRMNALFLEETLNCMTNMKRNYYAYMPHKTWVFWVHLKKRRELERLIDQNKKSW